MPSTLHTAAYRLIARSLGRALAYIDGELGHEPVAFRIAVDCLIRDMEEDNPRFDARRFRRALEAARLSEYDEAGDDPVMEGHDAREETKVDPEA